MPKVAHTALLLLSLAGVASCFVESAQPTTFRFQCSSTDECNDGEVCSDGLCQQPCGAGQEACSGTTVCLNGFCSSLCPINEDVCPAPQECVSLSASEGASGSGVCTISCDDTDHPCGEGQLCVVGFCVSQCMTADDCASGEQCTEAAPGLMVCTPGK